MKGACHRDLPQRRPLLAAADLGLPEAATRAARGRPLQSTAGWARMNGQAVGEEAGKVLAATARWEASTERKEAKPGWCPHLPSGSTPRLPNGIARSLPPQPPPPRIWVTIWD